MATFVTLPNGKTKAIVRRKEWGCKSRTKTFIRKGDAETWARGVESQLDKGEESTYHVQKGTIVGRVLELFRDEEVPKRKGARNDEYRINKFLREPWTSLTFADDLTGALTTWKEKCLRSIKHGGYGLAPGTVRRGLNLIHAAIEWARGEPHFLKLPINPVSLIKRPLDGGRRERLWDDADVQLFLDAFGYDMRVKPMTQTAKVGWIVKLARLTGWRLSEICAIQNQTKKQAGVKRNLRDRGYIDLSRPEVFFPATEISEDGKKLGGTKNDAGFHAPLRTEAVEVLQALLKHFPPPHQQDPHNDLPAPLLGINAGCAGQLYRRVRKKLAVEHPEMANILIHELRHTFTTEIADALDGDMPALLAITGRKSVASLLHYTHPDAGGLSKKLNAAFAKLA